MYGNKPSAINSYNEFPLNDDIFLYLQPDSEDGNYHNITPTLLISVTALLLSIFFSANKVWH